jgi:hypothetical protein
MADEMGRPSFIKKKPVMMDPDCKIFCVGSNKTGTTSLAAALQRLGFPLGEQAYGELLIDEWTERNFGPIVKFSGSAQAFQDIPFSLDDTYVALDQAYPGSKFILTVRNSAEEWYQSLVRFLTKLIGNGRRPTADDMKAFPYRYFGWIWQVHQAVYGIDEATLFDPQIYQANYLAHLAGVQRYFQGRDDLLVLNLSESKSMDRLCRFLGVKGRRMTMPHLNATRRAA